MRRVDVIGAVALAATFNAGEAAYAQSAAAPAAVSGAEDAGVQVSDPLEGLNRGLFSVHNAIDKAVLKPLALGYRAILPGPVRTGVRNVLRNASAPVIFVNDVLQAQPARAGVTAARFGVNTTVGLAGVFDVANGMGLARHSEDFGQTLGYWGVGEGPYLFIPVAGPTNVRDLVGRIVDIGIDPLTYAQYDGDDAVKVSRAVLTGLDAREQAIDPLDELAKQSPDMYGSIKRLYTASRRNDIKNGAVDVQALPDFDDTEQPVAPSLGAPQAAGAAPPVASEALIPQNSTPPETGAAAPSPQ